MTEKGELVTFLTDWYNGRIKKPENKAEIVELIKEKLPTVSTDIYHTRPAWRKGWSAGIKSFQIRIVMKKISNSSY